MPPEHLTQADNTDTTPMKYALWTKNLATLQHLVLVGAPVRPQDCPRYATNLLPTRNALLVWLHAEHTLRHTFTALILGCGVHGSHDVPPAHRSQLIKLRSSGLVEARMKLAGYLGVRVGAEAARVEAARAVVAAL